MVDVERVTVDVVVIGGGLAAQRAAIATRQRGAEVAVAVKGKLGRSGSSALTRAGYVAVEPYDGTQDRIESHYEDTLRAGADIADPTLVRVLCEEAGRELESLESIGCPFVKTETGYQLGPGADHTHPRVLSTVNRIGTDLRGAAPTLLIGPGCPSSRPPLFSGPGCTTAAANGLWVNTIESRGAHYQEDFSRRNDGRWKQVVVLQRVGDALVHEVRPVCPS